MIQISYPKFLADPDVKVGDPYDNADQWVSFRIENGLTVQTKVKDLQDWLHHMQRQLDLALTPVLPPAAEVIEEAAQFLRTHGYDVTPKSGLVPGGSCRREHGYADDPSKYVERSEFERPS